MQAVWVRKFRDSASFKESLWVRISARGPRPRWAVNKKNLNYKKLFQSLFHGVNDTAGFDSAASKAQQSIQFLTFNMNMSGKSKPYAKIFYGINKGFRGDRFHEEKKITFL